MVEIDESYLLFFIGAIFIPLFIFLIKMIIEAGKNAGRLDAFDDHMEKSSSFKTDIELLKHRLSQIEQDVKTLFRRFHNNSNMKNNNSNNNNDNE